MNAAAFLGRAKYDAIREHLRVKIPDVDNNVVSNVGR